MQRHVWLHPINIFTNTQNWPHICNFFHYLDPHDFGKCEIRHQLVEEYYIPMLQTSLALLILKGTTKTFLAILVYLYYEEIVKNSHSVMENCARQNATDEHLADNANRIIYLFHSV